MALKKGKKIWVVYIEKGIVTAFTKDMEPITINRSQRNALADYKNKDYIENVCRMLSHKDPFHVEFSVMKDGDLVYTLDQRLK